MPQDQAGREEERFAADELLERVDGDTELLQEVVAIYLEDTPTVIASLKENLSQNSTDAAAKAAHTLKGASANVSARRLYRKASELEALARNGDLEGARRLCKDVEEEFAALEIRFAAYLGDADG
jgi:HPt (histidine-containing phosphotransfer) domain-containing protein